MSFGHLGSFGGPPGRVLPWSPLKDMNTVGYYDGRDLTDGPVSSWTSRVSRGGVALQATSGSQPVAASGVVTFDGTDDRMTQFVYPMKSDEIFLESVALPDASGNNGAGTGFTCTGLCRAPDGTWWVGNHGRPLVGTTPTWAPSLVHLSADFTTKLGEILLVPLYASIQSVQGVTYDSSDDTLWFADVAGLKLRHVTTAGVVISSDEITLPNSDVPNGLFYNAGDDSIYANAGASSNFYRISAATGVVAKTWNYTEQDQADHVWFDPTNNLIWFSYGSSNQPGYLSAYNLTNNSLVCSYAIPELDCIEGIVLDPTNNKLYACNDGVYHAGSPPINTIKTFTLPYPTAPFGKTDIIDLFFVGKFLTTPAATKALISLGSPSLTSPVNQAGGIGLYATTNTNIRVLATTQDGTTTHQVVANNTSPSLASDRIVYVRVDTTADLISIWVDGTSIGTTAASTLDNGLLGLGNNLNIGGASSFFGNNAMRACGYTFGPGQRELWEGYASWSILGLAGANLPSSHLFKRQAP